MKTAKILIVEDESIIAMELEERLAHMGYEVTDIAADSNTALQKVKEQLPDIVMMDIHIKGSKDGIETAAEIRAQFSIPVIYLSAHSDEATMQRAKLTEPFGYLLKPFREQELHATIEMALYKRGMEKSLRESDERYRSMINTSPDGIVLTDLNGNILTVNKKTAEMHGYGTPEDMVGVHVLNLIVPEDHSKTIEFSKSLITSRSNTSMEYTILRRDGSTLPSEIHSSIISGEQGQPQSVMSVIRDITERKRAEEALHESGERYRAVIDSASDAIISADSAGNIIGWNLGAERIFGYTENEVRGQPLTQLQPAHYHAEHLSGIDRVKNGGDKHIIGSTIEQHGLRKDGSEFPLELSLSEWQVAGDKFFTAIIHDITARKQAEQQRDEILNRLQNVLDNMPLGCMITGFDEKISYVNNAAEKMFGYTREESLGKIHYDVGLPVELHEHVKSIFENAVSSNTTTFSTNENLTKDGRVIICEWSNTPLWNSKGGYIGMLSMAQDITERKRIEEQLHLNSRAIESATEGIIITDFNQPDNPIIFANQGFQKITGYSAAEAIGSNCRFLQGKDTDKNTLAELRQCIEQKKSFESEILNYRKDGTPFWNFLRISPILDESGNCTHFAGFQTDITERKQAEINLNRQNEYLSSLNEITRELLQHTDVTSLLNTVAVRAAALVNAPYGFIFLSEGNDLVLRAATGDVASAIGTREPKPGRGMLGKIWQSEQPLVIENYDAWEGRDISYERWDLRVVAGAPVTIRGEKYGVLEVARTGNDKRQFTPEEIDSLVQFADLTSLVLDNAQLYADAQNEINERKQAENKLIKRERFLALLNDMTHAIIAAQSFDDMVKALTNDITVLLEADVCYLTRWDPVKEQVFPVAVNAGLTEAFSNILFEKGENNLTTSALDAGRIIVAEDMENSPHASKQIIKIFPAKSAISIPLIYAGNKLGAAIVAFKSYHQFTQEELERAEQAGNQIALAVWNVQQDIELQRNLREARILADIALALSETERIGLDGVLNMIVASAQNLISNAEQTVIHLLDEKAQVLTSSAVAGFSNLEGGKKSIRLGEGIAGQVILSGETVNIADVNTDPRFIKLGTEPTYRSLLVAPVRSGKQNLGTISIQSNQNYAFTPNDIKLLSQFGTQAAIAIENANLLENTKQSLKEANALYLVNKGLVASLEPGELLQDTVELLQKNFNYHYVQIFVADPETKNFIMRAGSGEIGAQLKARGYQLAPGEGIVGYTAETGAAFFTNDVDDIVSFTRNPLLPDTKSELAIPVKIGAEIVGLLDIHQVPPKYLSQRDVQLVGAVAGQLAVALQKADLYETLQISLQQEKAIRNQLVQNERLAVMGRLLATVSHELNNPLQAIQNALFLLKEETNISEQGRQDLEIVLAESERMASLIERLRDTYRPIQAEDFQLTYLNNIVENVGQLISTHLRHNQITLEFNSDPALPAIPALGDQLRQVVLNLLMNAAEAMVEGGTINVSTEFLKESGEILLTVTDTGPGIPEELLPNIFEAFVTNKESGTGLGLTISYEIVVKHRGRITAGNNGNQGAIFKVWLPTTNGELV